ncbi:hypothetical protein ANN_13651 [Periplaneta americana]|uniref:Ionotropic glutamate receptor L-glutamate and glycine-binding domain-containing protein n=1 Tax=Periplaneta americana TaxID=6978 RepID=A0ABQ8TK00_PERAM|nr:hypothetical protein ANN_13651 [Periplaneta americana]
MAGLCEGGNEPPGSLKANDTTTPLSVQSRVTDVLSYILGSVLFCAYSAAVISFLTVRKTNLPFTNLEQLHKDKSYKVGTEQDSSTFMYFKYSEEALARDVFRAHLQSPATLPTSVLDGLQRVCHTSRYAFMVPLEEAAEHVPHLSCAVVFLPQNIFEMAFTIMINNHSPYIDLFRHTLQKFRETGVLQKLHQEEMKYNPKREEAAFKSVEMTDVLPVFCILATKGNIEGGRFGPVLWIEFGVAQWSELAPLDWPPRSPDFTICDNALWSFIKSIVAQERYDSIDELKDAVRRDFQQITKSNAEMNLFEDYRLNGVIWLAFLEEGQSARELLGTTYVRFDVLFLLARRAGTHVEILEAFRVTPEGPLLSRTFGILRGSVFIPESQSYYRRSLESNVIRTAIVNETKYRWYFKMASHPLIAARETSRMKSLFSWNFLQKLAKRRGIVPLAPTISPTTSVEVSGLLFLCLEPDCRVDNAGGCRAWWNGKHVNSPTGSLLRDAMDFFVHSETFLPQGFGNHGPDSEPPLTIIARGNKFAGFNGLLWSIFEEKLNFKTEVRIPGDNLWGSLKNGTWNGAMGMVLRKEVEAAVCGLGMTSKRAAYVRFITPVAVLRDKIFIRMTDTYVSGSWNNFLRSFSAGLWLTVAAFIFLMAIFFNVCYHIGVNHHKEESYELTLIECIFFVLAAFCQQGQTRTPLSFQCRLVFFTSYLLGVVLFCAYSAAIISFLTVRHVELPFNDLMQLKQDATYTLGVVDASMKLSKFQDAKSGILKDVYTTNILPGLKTLPRSVQSGLQKVCATPKYAFLAPIEKGAVYFPTLCCELFVLPKEVSFMPISIAFPKNSPYIELFDFFLFMENNIIHMMSLAFNTGIEAFSDVRHHFHSHSWCNCHDFFTNRCLQFVQ